MEKEKKKRYFEFKDGDYYFKIPNDNIISEKNWIKLLGAINALRKEQEEK